MFSWKSKEKEILKRVSELERAMDAHTKMISEVQRTCAEIDEDLSVLSRRLNSEIAEVNSTSKTLTASYLQLTKQRDETAAAFQAISDKMGTLRRHGNLQIFCKKMMSSFHGLYWSFYNFVYRHQMLVLAITCGIVAVAGFVFLVETNMR